MKIIPVILSGGAGTRLWPVSRNLYPKQLVKLINDQSLFQQTLVRCNLLSTTDPGLEILAPIVVCNEQHRFMIAQQAQEANQKLTAIILESTAKNTAPALTLAAKYIEQNLGEALMVVLPADHAIEQPGNFVDTALQMCNALTNKPSIGVFGVKPEWAHTGYGYIEMGEQSNDGLNRVVAFKEKPEKKVAEDYIRTGNFYWNSGMFVVSASIWSRSLQALNPEIDKTCGLAIENAKVDLDFIRVDEEAFSQSPSDSIDFAVIENIDALNDLNISVKMLALDCRWTDLGAWSSVSDYLDADNDGNVSVGDVIQEQSTNTFVMSQERLVATVGVKDLVVVETPDAVLVADKSKAQDVKKIVARLKQEGRGEHQVHRRVYRPWGNYETVDFGERYQVKRIVVNPGASLSLQMHHHRAEHWIVVHGTAEVTRGEETFLLSENESTYIPIGTTHRLVNPGKFPLELVEVQSGSYLGEDDIVRFEDIYGRNDDKVI